MQRAMFCFIVGRFQFARFANPGTLGGAAAFDILQRPSRGHREAKPLTVWRDRGYLPVVPLHPRKTEDDPGDLLLGGAIPETVESLQHMAHPPAFLPREGACPAAQARRRNDAEGGKWIYPIKSFQTDRDHGDAKEPQANGRRQDELEMLILAQLVEEERFATLFDRLSDIECGSCIAIQRERLRMPPARLCAGVGMRLPEHLRLWEELLLRIKRKSAVPTLPNPVGQRLRIRLVARVRIEIMIIRFAGDGAILPKAMSEAASPSAAEVERRGAHPEASGTMVSPSSVNLRGGASIPGTIGDAEAAKFSGAMPQRHRVDQSTLTFAHQLAITVLGHPAGTRKVSVVDPTTAMRIALWIEAEQNLNGFANRRPSRAASSSRKKRTIRSRSQLVSRRLIGGSSRNARMSMVPSSPDIGMVTIF